MKAVVLELRDSKAAVLDKEGIVSIIPDRDYRVGQVLEVSVSMLSPRESMRKRRSFSRFAGVAAAVLLLFSGAAGGYTAVATPVSSVTVEAEPSVQLNLNVLGRVVSVDALNEKAKDLSGDLTGQVKGKNLGEAVTLTLDFFEEKGFLGGEEDMPLVMTVEGGFLADAPRMEEVAQDSIKQWSDSHSGSLEFETMLVTGEIKEEARMEGMPPGQMVISQREGNDPGALSQTAPAGPAEAEKSPGGTSFDNSSEPPAETSFGNSSEPPAAPQGGFSQPGGPSSGRGDMAPSDMEQGDGLVESPGTFGGSPSQSEPPRGEDDRGSFAQGFDPSALEIRDLATPQGGEAPSGEGGQGSFGGEAGSRNAPDAGGGSQGSSFGGEAPRDDSIGSGGFGGESGFGNAPDSYGAGTQEDAYVGETQDHSLGGESQGSSFGDESQGSTLGDESFRNDEMGSGGYGGEAGYGEAGGSAPDSYGGSGDGAFGNGAGEGSSHGESFGGDSFGGGGPMGGGGF